MRYFMKCEFCGEYIDDSVKMFVTHEIPCFLRAIIHIIMLRIKYGKIYK